MSSLVLELQADAINRKVGCSDLLRKALVVSIKLEVETIENWIRQELNGYSTSSGDKVPDYKVPDYRVVRGQIKARNPYHGWQPVIFEDPELAETLSKREVIQPIAEFVSLLEDKGKNPLLQIPLPPKIANDLMGWARTMSLPTLVVPDTEIVRILDAVRNRILEWALELEKKGIVGKGMTFSTEERRAAEQVTYHTVNNIGSMQNSQFLQNSPDASQYLYVGTDLEQILAFIEQINAKKNDLELDKESASELQSEISTITTQSSSPKPKRKIINESLKSIRSILEGAAGSIAANGLLAQIAKLLQ